VDVKGFFINFLGLKPSQSEILSIQYLRGIASVSVMLFHFTYIEGPEVAVDSFSSLLYFIFSRMYLGVNIFFCISGFVLLYSLISSQHTYAKLGNFLLRRITRIEPPYIVSVLMVVAIAGLLQFIGKPTDKDISIGNILMHFGYLNTFTGDWLLDIYWTLAVEFVFYLSIGLAYPIVVGKPYLRIPLFLSFLAVGPFCPHHSLPFFAPYFVLGMQACLFYTKKINANEFWAIISIALFCMLFENEGFSFFITREGIIKCALSAATLFYFFTKPKLNWWLYVLGSISYSLYLLHTIFGSAILKAVKLNNFESPKKWLFIFAACMVSIVCSLLFYKYVEKPSIFLSKKLIGKQSK